jgi:hypothetical protein
MSVFAFALLSVSVVWSQGDCPALLQRALSAIETNCSELNRNSACYGYNLVQASFVREVPDDFFALPSDRAPVADLVGLKTAGLDVANDQWGVAVMSLQANIPNAIPGQAVTFVLLGDAEIENSTLPEDTFVPAEPVDAAVTTNARVRSGPGTNFNVIGVAEAGVVLAADAQSADGGWLRVAFRDLPLWISKSLVAPSAALDALPVYDGTQRAPMQAFFLRTGIGSASCQQADDVLMVQGPKNIRIDLTVNGANLSLGSTVLFKAVNNVLEIIVIDGEVTLYGAGEEGEDVTLTTGFRTTMCLGSPDNLGADGNSNDQLVTCPASTPEQVDFEQLGLDYCELEIISPGVLNYPVDLLCEGENLQDYLARVLVPARVPPSPPTPPPPTGDGVCSSITLIAPLGTVPLGTTTFSWQPAPGIDQYVMNIYNVDGVPIYGVQTDASTTSVVVDTINLPGGDRISWDVNGMRGGQIVCGSGRTATQSRAPSLTPPQQDTPVAPPPQGFTGSWSCNAESSTIPFSWSGAQPGDEITLYWDSGSEQIPGYGYGASGSSEVFCYGCNLATVTGQLQASPSGFIFVMPTLYNCGAW